jgi:hypothetical protein
MAFSVFVETLNLQLRVREVRPIKLRQSYVAANPSGEAEGPAET